MNGRINGADASEVDATARWTVLVPVKSTGVGKSRLAVRPDDRARIARALAGDTIAAVAAAERVRHIDVLVENEADAELFAGLPKTTARLVTARGLNEALAEGVAGLAETGPVAVLPADLPSLRPDELDDALRRAEAVPSAVVADRHGTGTTLRTALDREQLALRYGPDSYAAHLASGAVALDIPRRSGLRRDVDVLDDLQDAAGAATRAEAHRLEPNLTGA